MTIAALIVAAGRGTRAGGYIPKQWQMLRGQPVVAHSVAAFRAAGIERILLVHHAEDRDRAERLGVALAQGGATRDASVRAGLEALAGQGVTRVLIHDGARPLVSPALIARVLGALDDVEVARRAGHQVVIVPGEASNIKITEPADFARAARLMEDAMDIRTGTGFDVHAFGPGDQVMLCGVPVPHSHGLVGHSDADVGMHALTDAIYGALADGDIGRHFPPSDPQWKGAASETFLSHAAARARERGFAVSNCDVTLICERPKIGPHALAMAAKLAAILGIEASRVSVKATTTERLGFTGREEGIAAMASVTLVAP